MHSENMEIRRVEGRPFRRKFRKYRPKGEKVVYALVKRFCSNCLRRHSIVRGFKLQRSTCRKCPVLEAVPSIDHRLVWVRREREELMKRLAAVGGV